jgi:hypothetical protein
MILFKVKTGYQKLKHWASEWHFSKTSKDHTGLSVTTTSWSPFLLNFYHKAYGTALSGEHSCF